MALTHITSFSILVPDYNQAINYYCNVLGFELIENTQLSSSRRWIVVAPTHNCETRIILAEASNPIQKTNIGNQTGGRVGFFLQSDDFESDFERLTKKGVSFLEEPRQETYGTVCVFQDLYGNKWDLIQPGLPKDQKK